MPRLTACVLISGSGTNLQALIDARAASRLDIDIVHVISDVPDAAGLDRARGAGIAASVLKPSRFASRLEFDRALAALMDTNSPGLFVFAGFMRIVGEPVLERHGGRMINLHPSLLPKYPGLDTYRRVLDAGDTEHGASVHFLTATLDGGPVIAQRRIPVRPGDTPDELRQRLAPEEHRLIVATVELFAQRRVELDDGRVLVDDKPGQTPLELDDHGTLGAV